MDDILQKMPIPAYLILGALLGLLLGKVVMEVL